MCRFAAYSGPAIPLENIVVRPKHSLLEQSQNATEAKLAVNGDGFGFAWYADREEPGLYRDVLPAWSDGNLISLCRNISSHIFLAHVRASTVGETSRSNCHPFVHKNWSFMHNGQIGDFAHIRRGLEASLPDTLYNSKQGGTDSELLFLLLLAHGLMENPLQAVRSTIDQVNAAQHSRTQPNRITAAFSDGTTIYAFRTSSDRRSPTLYHGADLDNGGQVLASEPMDPDIGSWRLIEENSFVVLREGRLSVTPLNAINTQSHLLRSDLVEKQDKKPSRSDHQQQPA